MPMKIAYLMSRFPKITETFILYEILALQAQGIAVEIFPLQRERTKVMHPEAAAMMDKVRFLPFISFSLIFTNLACLFRHPINYLSTLLAVLRGTWGSRHYFLGALVFFPKAVGIARQCQQQGVTHVHAHFANHPALVAFIVFRLTGIGYSFTAHGSDLHKRQQMLAEKFKHSRFTVMISQYNKQFFYQKTGLDGGDKMPVIHCGIDPTLFTVADSPTMNSLVINNSVVNSPVNILCVASLREVKGHCYLIEACHLLKQRGIAFNLHLAGDGPKHQAIVEQISALDLNEQVILHGAVTRPQVIDLLAQCDIFALSSFQTPSGNREGIPVVIMEAMACGLAVVASRVSGIPELVEDHKTGLLASPQDPGDIADQLEVLILNPTLRKTMGLAGREKVISEFNLQQNIKQLIGRFKGV